MKTIDAPPEAASAPHETSSYEKVSFLQRVGLGFGGIPDLGMQYAIMSMANPIFNVALGVNPVLIGIAMALPRFWEMIIDPWIGGLSDRTRNPMGRRHPYIILGGILGGLTFSTVWWVPPAWTTQEKGYWLIVFALLHFTAYSLFMVPYSALLSEVSSNKLERTRIMAMRTAFTSFASCGISWLYWLCQRPAFHDPVAGMRVVGIGFGVFMTLSAIIPTLVCPRTRLFQPSQKQVKTRETFIIREILRIRSFRCVIFAVLALLGSFTLVSNLSFYINLYYVFNQDARAVAVLQGVAALVVCGTTLATCAIVSYCAKVLGRAFTLRLFMMLTLLGKVTSWWTYSPQWPYASIISIVLTNAGVTAFWIFMPSLIGEISNRHEAETGESLYGSFCALYGVSLKVAASAALLCTGVLLNLTHFDVHLKVQAAETLTNIRLLNVILPTAGVLLALFYLRGVWSKSEPAAGHAG